MSSRFEIDYSLSPESSFPQAINDALKSDWSRDRIIEEIISYGAPAFSGSCSELYREKCFTKLSQTRLENAKTLGERSLMFLVDHTFDEEMIARYGEIILSVLRRAIC